MKDALKKFSDRQLMMAVRIPPAFVLTGGLGILKEKYVQELMDVSPADIREELIERGLYGTEEYKKLQKVALDQFV